jgi:hypothetical protein
VYFTYIFKLVFTFAAASSDESDVDNLMMEISKASEDMNGKAPSGHRVSENIFYIKNNNKFINKNIPALRVAARLLVNREHRAGHPAHVHRDGAFSHDSTIIPLLCALCGNVPVAHG